MAGQVKAIPDGYHTITPYLAVHDAAKAIDFYKKAFDAREVHRMVGPNGKIGHAELKIGDSMLMLSDEMPGAETRSPQTLHGTTTNIFLYVRDVDESYKKAVAAGCQATQPVTDMFWGDRFGKLTDPFGYTWSMATHKEDVAPEEMEKRAQAAMAKMAGQHKTGTA
jgi:PhnB protein